MQVLARSVIALFLVAPTTALAQTPTRADLVGTWVRAEKGGEQDQFELLLTLNADSTWNRAVKKNGQTRPPAIMEGPGAQSDSGRGRWYLSGDSLWMGDRAVRRTVKYGDSTVTESMWEPIKVVIDKGKLLLLGYRGIYDIDPDNPKVKKLKPVDCKFYMCFERGKAP